MTANLFQSFTIAPGTRVHVMRDPRFRRTHVTCFLSNPLDNERISRIALLPAVLVRGTARLPKAHLLEQEMASLYGARMGAGVSKTGDKQVIRVGLNLSNEKYAGVPILGDGLTFLNEILSHPLISAAQEKVPASSHGPSFDANYVEQEKRQLIGRIRAIINNKVRYALIKGIEQIFTGEPAAWSEEGTEAGAEAVTPEALALEHERVMVSSQMDVYVLGDVDVHHVCNQVQTKMQFAGRVPNPLQRSIVVPGAGSMKRSFATEPMEQGWIILGIKSDVAMSSSERWSLAMANGILGGFPHSKLFTNVREKASLAYSAGSFSDATKGAIFAYAGIEPMNYYKASDLMIEQLKALSDGDFTADEMESTREAMLTDFKLQEDSPGYLIHTHYTALSEECYEDVPSSIEGIRRVSRDDVVALASKLRCDTLFFLSGKREDELNR